MKILTLGQKLGRKECPYMRRWVLNCWLFSIRLHHWYSSDDSRNFHDHSWDFVGVVLQGRYWDIAPLRVEEMPAGKVFARRAKHTHWVKVDKGGCWTLLLTGPPYRKWGFWIKKATKIKWVKANKYFATYGEHPCE